MKKISVIYVYYNTPQEIINSIKSLKKNTSIINAEIIIIDNNSPQSLPVEIKKSTEITIIHNKKNKGYGSALNQGAKIAIGKYLVFLNPGTLVPRNFISKCLKRMDKDQKIGLLGVRYKNGENKFIKSVGGLPGITNLLFSFSIFSKIFPYNKYSKEYWQTNFNYKKEQDVPVVGGACMIVRKEVFEKLKGFDDQFFMYFEEADFSIRVKETGYKVVYNPGITITHLAGRSSSDNKEIKKRFEDSRYKILKKYNGTAKAILTEALIRLSSLTSFALILIIFISTFLNLYKIDELMMFYGDFGRDFLAARDMILTGNIPLRGIPSSVVWLHQGPLSIYFIGLAFLLSNYNPVAPAVLYSVLGVTSVYLVYLTTKEYFNSQAGLIAALFYATSPLIVVNSRMPYHTSPIPFFTLALLFVLSKILKGEKALLSVLFFIAGLLFMLELSNSVLLGVIVILLFLYRIKISSRDILKSILGFSAGILPFIIFDIQNNFLQLGGFILWVINRIRLFFGIAAPIANASNINEAVILLWSEINRIIFPTSETIALLFILLASTILIVTAKKTLRVHKLSIVIVLAFIIPLLGFLVHTKPGVAYTPVLFPAISALIGYAFYELVKTHKLFILLLIAIILFNSLSLIRNNYYLSTDYTVKRPEMAGYSFGLDLKQRIDAVNAIIKDSNSNSFQIKGGGYLKEFPTGVDNYKYLAWYKKGELNANSNIIYKIYEDKSEVPDKSKIIHDSTYITVTKNE